MEVIAELFDANQCVLAKFRDINHLPPDVFNAVLSADPEIKINHVSSPFQLTAR